MGRPKTRIDVNYNCSNCGDPLVKQFAVGSAPKTSYCNRQCQNIHYKTRFGGSNNPRHGIKHSSDSKQKMSNAIKLAWSNKSYEEYYGKDVAESLKAQRSVVFAKSGKLRIGDKNSFYGKKHSIECKTIIGQKSAQKFNSEYNVRFKNTMINNGHWVSDADKSDYDVYCNESSWISDMYDHMEDISLLEQHGKFSPWTNPRGVVRDHILSRANGYDLKLFPEILRHPANCQLLTNGDNSRKRKSSWITIDELFDKIQHYNKYWAEQDLVLSLIEQYKSGNIWKRKEVV